MDVDLFKNTYVILGVSVVITLVLQKIINKMFPIKNQTNEQSFYSYVVSGFTSLVSTYVVIYLTNLSSAGENVLSGEPPF